MNRFKLYTDGSHFKSSSINGRLGIGGVLINESGEIVDYLSKEVDRYEINEIYNTSDVSNPTMEMYAVLLSLRKFSKRFQFNDYIEIFADYLGVISWMNNEWRINKPYIRMIKSDIELEIKNQKLEVKFIKVKGHSNEYFNDLADKLAKGELKRI